jgi:hypothetical protein
MTTPTDYPMKIIRFQSLKSSKSNESWSTFALQLFSAMKIVNFAIVLLFSIVLYPFVSYGQTLRGLVRDADNGEAIVGATIALQYQRNGTTPVALATNPEGEFVFENLRAGYYSISINAQGYERQTLVEIHVVAGKEQLLEISLRRSAAQLEEVTIRATLPGRRTPLPLGEIPLTRDQTLRFPAMFFDPARLAAAYPGVAQTDDGTNNLSIRGNSPASVRWRLEGVDIVNPNHLPNAGTFSDRLSAAGGGVLMFSAQLLDNSSLLTGAMPAGYGDALGGIMDMNLRRGNNRRHEFTAQAGLIGLDLAAEGPMGKSGKNSYLANYRYSTVGLLGQLGVSFGDEQINFQDFSFNLNLAGRKGGHWSVFGMGGLSENIFKHKTDTAEIKAYKDFFDIDYASKTAVIGASNWSPLWRNAWIKTSVAWSAQAMDRNSISPVLPDRNTRDRLDENKISAAFTFSQRLGKKWGLLLGANANRNNFDLSAIGENQIDRRMDYEVLLLQPWVQAAWNSADGNTQLRIGAHSMIFRQPYPAFFQNDDYAKSLEPRVSVSQRFGKHRLSAAFGLYSQVAPAWLFQRNLPLTRSAKGSIGYQWNITNEWVFSAELFQQSITDAFFANPPLFYSLNAVEYQPGNDFFAITSIDGTNRGIELSVERRLANGWFLLANASWINSQSSEPGSSGSRFVSTRWDYGHLTNLTFGKEWQREKRPGKERTIGLNARSVWNGGARAADYYYDQATNTTQQDETRGYNRQFADYFRVDLRVYWRKNLGNRRNSTFALDLQNLTNRLNLAYHYYDQYTGKIATKYQIGTIPNFSWRLEF